MSNITQNGLDLIKRFEGFSRTVYFCPAGYPTIGYGHVVKDDEDFSAGIDEAQAEELLRQDAVIAERAVLRLINVPLTGGQFDALAGFCKTCWLAGFDAVLWRLVCGAWVWKPFFGAVCAGKLAFRTFWAACGRHHGGVSASSLGRRTRLSAARARVKEASTLTDQFH